MILENEQDWTDMLEDGSETDQASRDAIDYAAREYAIGRDKKDIRDYDDPVSVAHELPDILVDVGLTVTAGIDDVNDLDGQLSEENREYLDQFENEHSGYAARTGNPKTNREFAQFILGAGIDGWKSITGEEIGNGGDLKAKRAFIEKTDYETEQMNCAIDGKALREVRDSDLVNDETYVDAVQKFYDAFNVGVVSGSSTSGVLAAATYKAAKENGEDLNQSEIADLMGVTNQTLRSNRDDMQKWLN